MLDYLVGMLEMSMVQLDNPDDTGHIDFECDKR